MNHSAEKVFGLIDRAVIGLLLFLVLLLIGVQMANATEIIPAVGLTRPVEGGSDAEVFGSLGLRSELLPFLKTELGVAYRSENRFDDRLKLRMWPITASVWASPLPVIYAGGGVGWYNITYDYDQTALPAVRDETKQEFGVHLGGGVQVPLGPAAGLDLNGRYVMMRDQDSPLIPSQFDPDFWTTSLGLAIKF